MPLVTLTTDFGTRDYYAGAVKGAILTVAPQVQVVDLSHEIPPQDVLAGAFVLHRAAREFPAGTVHVAVVDPGVGSARRPLAVAAEGQTWVGPDNGVFSFVLADPAARVRRLEHPRLRRPTVSPTFHGRDLFAPAAAHLALGFPFADVGPQVGDPVRLEEARPSRQGDRLVGQVLHVDRFGNLVTNLSEVDLAADPAGLRVTVGGGPAVDGLQRTYADAPRGALLALIGSAGLLEVAVREGDASRRLGAGRGATVTVEPR